MEVSENTNISQLGQPKGNAGSIRRSWWPSHTALLLRTGLAQGWPKDLAVPASCTYSCRNNTASPAASMWGSKELCISSHNRWWQKPSEVPSLAPDRSETCTALGEVPEWHSLRYWEFLLLFHAKRLIWKTDWSWRVAAGIITSTHCFGYTELMSPSLNIQTARTFLTANWRNYLFKLRNFNRGNLMHKGNTWTEV